jgi:integral membrane protein
VSGALLRYRVMAYLVGVMLIVLVCVGVPLQYAASQPGVVKIVGPLHGFLYIVYLIAAFDLMRRARLSLWQLVAMVAAGLVPGLAFLVERVVTRRVETRLRAGELSP